MAKYDSYRFTVHAGGVNDYCHLELNVLFEQGDDIPATILAVRNLLKNEAVALKAANFVKSIEQK